MEEEDPHSDGVLRALTNSDILYKEVTNSKSYFDVKLNFNQRVEKVSRLILNPRMIFNLAKIPLKLYFWVYLCVILDLDFLN